MSPSSCLRSCLYHLLTYCALDSLIELGILLPIHIAAVVSTLVFLRTFLPNSFVHVILEPLEYADGENPYIVDFGREVIASMTFTMGIKVLPVLFRLNHLPKWAFIILMYPLFNFAVDASGLASSFSPNIVLALSIMRYQPLPSLWRFIASILGGLFGGRVMNIYFPDQEGRRRIQ